MKVAEEVTLKPILNEKVLPDKEIGVRCFQAAEIANEKTLRQE